MKRSRRSPDEVSLFHILLGAPDDDCEVCRAHGLTGHDLPEGAPGILMPGTLDDFLRCPCPLCTQITFESFEDPAEPGPEGAPEE
jgi:hypothetical protein